MEELMTIASYVYNRYGEQYGVVLDEMKLHKLLYFVQRESLIQDGVPLFDATFYGWKYGPVLHEIRKAYRDNTFYTNISESVVNRIKNIMDKVFQEYSAKDAWSLSRLTHGEISWKNSRIGVADGENSDRPMVLDDIRKDAERIKERRNMLMQLGLS